MSLLSESSRLDMSVGLRSRLEVNCQCIPRSSLRFAGNVFRHNSNLAGSFDVYSISMMAFGIYSSLHGCDSGSEMLWVNLYYNFAKTPLTNSGNCSNGTSSLMESLLHCTSQTLSLSHLRPRRTMTG